MPELTRRRSIEAREECWHVYGDVRVGTIAKRAGIPFDGLTPISRNGAGRVCALFTLVSLG
jgi:hypothetical protein